MKNEWNKLQEIGDPTYQCDISRIKTHKKLPFLADSREQYHCFTAHFTC